MSTYQGIRGLKVRDYTTNPDNPLEGQLWYNKTDQVGKYQVPVVTTTGAWRTANSINTARDDGYMVGAQTSAILFGGKTNPPPSRIGVVESYDGVSFTEVNDLNTARGGTFGGGISNTSAIAAGGQTGSGDGTAVANVETWNGSSWTETTDINLGRYLGASGGTSTSTLIFGGYPAGGGAPGYADKTESWNGSTWTEVNDLNTARYGPHYGGIGTYIDTLCVGGYTEQAVVEQWNGSSWTEVADIATGRENCSAAGSNTNGAIMAGGSTSTTAQLATAQEWNNAVAVGAWSTGTAVNTARQDGAGSGTSTSSLFFAGAPYPNSAQTESWNGTSWTEVADLNQGRATLCGAGVSNTSALAYAGYADPGGVQATTETWNGSSWTEVNDMNTARYGAGRGVGTSTSALAVGGNLEPGLTANAESWNGSSWTEVNDLNTTRQQGASAGDSNTSALAFGGETATAKSANVEVWNGSSFTESSDLNTARDQLAGVGHFSSTAVLAVGGKNASNNNVANNEEWNGASFVELADLSNGTKKSVGVGTTSSALNISGGYPGGTNYTGVEEWSGSTNSTKTIDTD